MTDLDPMSQSAEPAAEPQPAPDSIVPVTSGEYETTLLAAPAAPVHATESARRRPVRWPVAIGLIALVLAVSAFVGILVTGRAPNARVLGYVPAGTLVYGEARLDLPGDQRTALASFLSKFPGFADQSAIEGKLNEVMDRFVGGVTNGDQAYTTDIQPWFDGELAFALPALPDPSSLTGSGSSVMAGNRSLILVSIKDPAAASAWLRSLVATTGATLTDETYDGATLSTASVNGGSDRWGYAVLDGKVEVLGDVASVKAAIDTQGKGPFAAQASPKAALEATDSSHVGFMYVDVAAMLDWASKVSGSVGSTISPGFDVSSSALRGVIPDWEGLALRVEGDALVLEAAADRPATTIGPTQNRATTLTDHVPASAVAVGIGHDLGATLTSLLDAYRAQPSLKTLTDGIDQAIGLAGGADAAVGWIGDTGYVVNQSDGSIEAGIVIAPTDRAAADHLLTSLRSLLAIGSSVSGISVHDDAYAGTTITTIDLGDVGALLSQSGLAAELGTGATLPTGRVELSYAVTDQVVAIGSGPSFVEHILDTTPATSLGATDRYKSLVGRIGTGTGVTFVDIAAIRGMLEAAMASADPGASSTYEQEIKPFLAPFDALIEGRSIHDGSTNGKVIVTVK